MSANERDLTRRSQPTGPGAASSPPRLSGTRLAAGQPPAARTQQPMWSSQASDAGSHGAVRFEIRRESELASYADVIAAWRTSVEFRKWFNDVLSRAPFDAFRWETPPVTEGTAGRSFEFVLLESPDLVREPSPEAFARQFETSPSYVVTFSNLGGDATLVVPRPMGPQAAYGHLGAFVRDAPEAQQLALWQAVGEAMLARLGASPVWLSTAGAGVPWLHVRLDDRPKYYAFAPFRARP